MKFPLPVLVLCALFCCVMVCRADEKNGVRMNVQKTLFDRSVDREAFTTWDKVDKALGLKIDVQNIAMKELPAGKLDWTVIVKRWGRSPMDALERLKGSDPVQALKPGEKTQLKTGKVRLGGYETLANRKGYMDEIEAWQVVLTIDGAEVIRMGGGPKFDKADSRAKDISQSTN